jgi:hypothetical protein
MFNYQLDIVSRIKTRCDVLGTVEVGVECSVISCIRYSVVQRV